MVRAHPESQSPFGFWGEWNYRQAVFNVKRKAKSQSPFGFWGEWNSMGNFEGRRKIRSHNRLSAFGVSGTQTAALECKAG